MSFEGLDDWDEIFLDQAIRIGLIATSATNPILILDPQSPPPPPPPLVASHDFHSFSPPREFSQKFTENKDPPRPSNGIANMSIGNSSPLVRRVGKDKEIEIDRLKRELGRVSKQLTRTEQECTELKKDRTKKEEQLKSVFSQIEAKDAEINLLKSINVEYGAIIQDHPGISLQCQNANTPIDQGGLGSIML